MNKKKVNNSKNWISKQPCKNMELAQKLTLTEEQKKETFDGKT